jgi:hypothetical protein
MRAVEVISFFELYVTMKFLRVEKSTGHHVKSCHSPLGQGEIFLWLRFPKHDTISQAFHWLTTRVRHAILSSSPVLFRSNIGSTRFVLNYFERKGRKEGRHLANPIPVHFSYKRNRI